LLSLIDDPRIVRPIEQVFQEPIMWWRSDENYYVSDTAWHPDGSDLEIELRHIKASPYLDFVMENSGSIRFIPGSHRQPIHGDLEILWVQRLRQIIAESRAENSAIDEYRARGFDVDSEKPALDTEQSSLPCHAVESRPGDVVFFDQNLYHSSFGGRSGRRILALCYCTVPHNKKAQAHT